MIWLNATTDTLGPVRVGLSEPPGAGWDMWVVGAASMSDPATDIRCWIQTRRGGSGPFESDYGLAPSGDNGMFLRLSVNNSTTPGNVTLRWAPVLFGQTVTVKAGSCLEATRIE